MPNLKIKAEFASRERKFLTALLIFALPFAVVVVINSFSSTYINPGFPFVIMVLGFMFATYRWYRCPKCNSIPRALGNPGVQLFAKKCGEWGAQLRGKHVTSQ